MLRAVTRANEADRVGLCAECVHGRRIESDRGAVFWLCELATTDAGFPKYPRLPVIECEGFERDREGFGTTDEYGD